MNIIEKNVDCTSYLFGIFHTALPSLTIHFSSFSLISVESIMATPFTIAEEDLPASRSDEDTVHNNASDKIPILKRRAAAAASGDGGEKGAAGCDPICVIVVGMAGSGKTTLMAQLQKSLNLKARQEEAGDSREGAEGGRVEDGGGADMVRLRQYHCQQLPAAHGSHDVSS